jgi:uncharacterized repeat protein (TIGR03847 family)
VSRRIFQYERPDRFSTGTVGEPGQRIFYLQAAEGERITAVVLEKVQVAVLADRIMAVVGELQRRGLVAAELVPEGDDEQPLFAPLQEEFRVGNMTIAWDEEREELVVEARSMSDEEDEEAEEEVEELDDAALVGPDVLRVRLTPAMALGFSSRATRVVAAGRPPCPFCGQPLEPAGHLCPRRNGTGYLH